MALLWLSCTQLYVEISSSSQRNGAGARSLEFVGHWLILFLCIFPLMVGTDFKVAFGSICGEAW